LERIVRTCLAKEREARWQTAREVALSLGWISDPALSGSGATAAVARAPRRSLASRIAIGLRALLLLAALGWVLHRRAPRAAPATPVTAPSATMTMTALTSGGRAASGEIID